MNWRCRRCPRSRAATTCSPRNSTTRLFAPPMACLTRPPTRCARSARSARDWTCAAARARACGSSSPCAKDGSGRRLQHWHARAGAQCVPGRQVGTGRRPGPALRRGLRPGGQFRSARALPARERPALFAGVHRALRPGGVFAFPIGAPQRITSSWYWGLLGFDLAMRVRNALWRPPFVMYYRTCPLHAVRDDLTASGFTVTTVPLTAQAGARTAARDAGLSSRAADLGKCGVHITWSGEGAAAGEHPSRSRPAARRCRAGGHRAAIRPRTKADLAAALPGVALLGIRSKTRVSRGRAGRGPGPAGGRGVLHRHRSDRPGSGLGARRRRVQRAVLEHAQRRRADPGRDHRADPPAHREGPGDARGQYGTSRRHGAHEVRGRTLGIVGYGNIGAQLSVVGEALGMRVVFYDTADKLALGNARRCVSLDELLEMSDIVSLHVDGRPSNSSLFGEKEFSQMRPGALFLNLCRGFVIDHEALRSASAVRPPGRRGRRRLPRRAAVGRARSSCPCCAGCRT